MTRNEYLDWCKQDAKRYLDRGDLAGAVTAMLSDLNNNPETSNHPMINLGAMMMFGGLLNTKDEVEKFILGFH